MSGTGDLARNWKKVVVRNDNRKTALPVDIAGVFQTVHPNSIDESEEPTMPG
jgi:hypothetical protein